MTKSSTTKSTKSNLTFSFFRLIDGTMMVGVCEDLNEQSNFVIVNNAVLLGCVETSHIEQKYYFRGMSCPFSLESPIITKLQKSTIISINIDLDSHLEKQYNKYVKSWFNTRDKSPTIDEKTKNELEQQISLLSKALANTVVH